MVYLFVPFVVRPTVTATPELQRIVFWRQLVYSDVISNVTGGDFKKEVNMSNKVRGVYFLSIINEEGRRTEKLIVY